MKRVNFIVAVVLGSLAGAYVLCVIIVLIPRTYYLSYNPQFRRAFTFVGRAQLRFVDIPLAKLSRKLLSLFGIRPFSYEALDPETNQIRLLKLLPGTKRDEIECRIFHASLDDKDLRYETLSYTWGKPFPVRTIRLNSQKFCVTPNLHAALRCLRRSDEPRVLWIDAACINQLDLAERGQQVGLMRRIYTQGSNVCVWLGAEECHREVKKLFEVAGSSKDHSTWLQSTIGDVAYISAWRELRRILSREYWYRMWIIQEITLAPSATVMCGNSVIQWDILLACNTVWKHAFTRRNIEHYDWICQVERVPGWRYFKLLYAWPDMQFYTLSESQITIGPASLYETHLDIGSPGSRRISFPELVFRHSRSRATDFKDKIYALLGLTRDPLMSDFPIDYSLSPWDAYKALVEHYIVKSGKLDILTYVTADGNNLIKPMSSWIPDWNPDEKFAESRQHLSRVTAKASYDAARGSVADVQYLDGNEDNYFNPRLQLKGCIVDRIDHDWKTPDASFGPSTPASDIQATQEMVSRWYIDMKRYYSDSQQFREIFWRVLVGNRDADGNPAPEEWAVAIEVVLFGESSLPTEYMADSTLSKTERANLFIAPYLSAVSQNMANKYIFTTTSGHIGVAPKRGDNVLWESAVNRLLKPERYLCIFPGCSFPMVIQKHLVRKERIIEKLLTAYTYINWIWWWGYTDDYDLVGAAYLHGFMEGQAMSDIDSGVRKFEDIILA